MKYKRYHLSAKPAPKHYATISRRSAAEKEAMRQLMKTMQAPKLTQEEAQAITDGISILPETMMAAVPNRIYLNFLHNGKGRRENS